MARKWFIVPNGKGELLDNTPIEHEKIEVSTGVIIRDSAAFYITTEHISTGVFSVKLDVLDNHSGKDEDLAIKMEDPITKQGLTKLAIPAWIILAEGIEHAMALCIRERVERLEITEDGLLSGKLKVNLITKYEAYSATTTEEEMKNALDFSQQYT